MYFLNRKLSISSQAKKPFRVSWQQKNSYLLKMSCTIVVSNSLLDKHDFDKIE